MSLVSAGLDIPTASDYACDWALIDVETSVLVPRRDRMLSVAVVTISPEGEQSGEFSTLLNPGCDPGPVEVHGLTAERLRGAPTFAHLLRDLWRPGAARGRHEAIASGRPATQGIPCRGWPGDPSGLPRPSFATHHRIPVEPQRRDPRLVDPLPEGVQCSGLKFRGEEDGQVLSGP
ncbi:exonuclease domain-containing protein [Streptomyces sp. NBC_00878]|uniref:exonuclease domain-containing protein n=1 Tax=Streptomyces sp. NBC_00878 TaxID=2975854 RepID=UPI00224F2960|nr:exonuclease domain-containing protein [Streptomyces sp. NBC_00878]MCX4910793.1 exonuclease domain-containing protein [Streptomyces sp. NBC_00878]